LLRLYRREATLMAQFMAMEFAITAAALAPG
jgi:hypothetical protein